MAEQNSTMYSTSDNEPDWKRAVEFIFQNRTTSSQNLDKARLIEKVSILLDFSKEEGLPHHAILKICSKIIFEDCYDVKVRRQLLFSCIPHSRKDFPYSVLPLAICTASMQVGNSSILWKKSILFWIIGLLQYKIIDSNHDLMKLCYTPLFQMLPLGNVCSLACHILCIITSRKDVLPFRNQILLRLKQKVECMEHIPHLLRVYQVYRPDLVAFRHERLKPIQLLPLLLKDSLASATDRFAGNLDDDAVEDSQVWPGFSHGKKNNPYQEMNCIPEPDFNVYGDTIEEKKEKKIAVLQYQSIEDMIKHIPNWKRWQWPNNASSLLLNPAVISLFVPDNDLVKISISNWLEMEFKAEIIQQQGNQKKGRREKLLETAINLTKYNTTLIPAIFHFLLDYLIKWDLHSHMEQILDLLRCLPFTSPAALSVGVLQSLFKILDTASPSLWCVVIDALADMAVTWGIQAEKESKRSNYTEWPLQYKDTCPLEGIHYLTVRLERVFLAAFNSGRASSLVINATISYYNKVNMVCETLNLPIFVFPPTEFFLLVIMSGNLVVTHRIGKILCEFQDVIRRVKFIRYNSLDEKRMRDVCMSSRENMNLAIMIYLDSLVASKFLCNRWFGSLKEHFSPEFFQRLLAVKGISRAGDIAWTVPFLSFGDVLRLGVGRADNKSETAERRNQIVRTLAEHGLNGIDSCVRKYINNDS